MKSINLLCWTKGLPPAATGCWNFSSCLQEKNVSNISKTSRLPQRALFFSQTKDKSEICKDHSHLLSWLTINQLTIISRTAGSWASQFFPTFPWKQLGVSEVLQIEGLLLWPHAALAWRELQIWIWVSSSISGQDRTNHSRSCDNISLDAPTVTTFKLRSLFTDNL